MDRHGSLRLKQLTIWFTFIGREINRRPPRSALRCAIDRTRRKMVARLARAPATIGELAEPFAMSLPAVSKHVRVLERAGLVRRTIDGRIHRCALDRKRLRRRERMDRALHRRSGTTRSTRSRRSWRSHDRADDPPRDRRIAPIACSQRGPHPDCCCSGGARGRRAASPPRSTCVPGGAVSDRQHASRWHVSVDLGRVRGGRAPAPPRLLVAHRATSRSRASPSPSPRSATARPRS